jgi:uncharacterized protein
MQERERFYRRAQRMRRDDSNALLYLLAAAQMGHLAALVDAGRRYVRGWGCEPDPERGFGLLEKAAAAGWGEAYWQLAYFHRNGIGTAKDARQALVHAIRGFSRTHAAHCATMAGDIYAEDLLDERRSFKWTLRGARAGDTDAMTSTGISYLYGHGVAADHAEAVRWFRRAARRGCRQAHNNLALCYRNGEGVPVDRRRAFAHRLCAAELGHRTSKIAVAAWRIDGFGVRRDPKRGMAALRRLARTDPRAAVELGERLLDGEGVAKNARKGIEWLVRAADAGSPMALNALGVRHFHGRGLRRDPTAAVRLYRAAALQGNGAAWRNLGLCYQVGEGVDRDVSKARLCFAAARENGYECDEQGNLAKSPS